MHAYAYICIRMHTYATLLAAHRVNASDPVFLFVRLCGALWGFGRLCGKVIRGGVSIDWL